MFGSIASLHKDVHKDVKPWLIDKFVSFACLKMAFLKPWAALCLSSLSSISIREISKQCNGISNSLYVWFDFQMRYVKICLMSPWRIQGHMGSTGRCMKSHPCDLNDLDLNDLEGMGDCLTRKRAVRMRLQSTPPHQPHIRLHEPHHHLPLHFCLLHLTQNVWWPDALRGTDVMV